MILNPQKKDELCEETFTKPNIGLSLRLLCNLHSIDPPRYLVSDYPLTPHYWRASLNLPTIGDKMS